jgi:hypothetical protein
MKKLPTASNEICLYSNLVSLLKPGPEKVITFFKRALTTSKCFTDQMGQHQSFHPSFTQTHLLPFRRLTGNNNMAVPENSGGNPDAGILRSLVFFNWKDHA